MTLFRRRTDRSTFSSELIASITDWPSEYHLSRARHCLLRPLAIPPGSKVLELGCGCGAITRYLGEIGAEVVAVEGSLSRARVAAERCRDLPNVRIFVDDLLRFETEERFDYVLLIGVLEYAAVFSTQENPFAHYLHSVTRFLAPGGRVVVAIENKLGLKYFNGCAEDHVGIPFFGIQDLYGSQSARTFGRVDLKAQLAAAGLPNTYFYYPFPDYKLPTVVLAEEALSDPAFDAIDLLARSHARDYNGSPFRSFDDALAFSVLHDNRLLADLSNSFLVVATAEPVTENAPAQLAAAYSVYRAPEFCVQTRFMRRATGIQVVKELLTSIPVHPVLVPDGTTITHRMDGSTYRPGRQLLWRLLKARARSGDLTAVVEALRPWMDFLLQHARVPGAYSADVSGGSDNLAAYKLPGNFLDCTPFNVLDAGNELFPIDLEWQSDREVSLGWVLVRGVLYALLSGIPSVSKLQSNAEVIQSLARQYGMLVSDDEIQAWMKQEECFQREVSDGPIGLPTIELTSRGLQLWVSEIPRLNQMVNQREEELASLHQMVAARDERIRFLNEAVGVRDTKIAELDQLLAGTRQELASVQAANQVAAGNIDQLQRQLSNARQQLAMLEGSISWKATRIFRDALSPFPGLRRNIKRALRLMWWTVTLQLAQRLRARRGLLRDRDLIANSALFDAGWYTRCYSDVAAAKWDPALHYALFGASERRNPGPQFDAASYLERYSDVANAGWNPLVHYLQVGVGEGRKLTAVLSQELPDAQENWDSVGRERLQQLLHGNSRIAFPVSEKPAFSFILVFYNKAHLSLLCLESILQNADVPYEVIIVNNCSQDETSELLQRIDGASIINNDSNAGFGEASVGGAKQARGEYLCFLNNDTLLQPDALSVVVGNFYRDPAIGAVGGKILLANGKLQEAGSILWSDGSALGYGRGDSPHLMQYEFRRPVDYCSGAFLFTRRSLFHELGGFDKLFGRAYYEDADYCMQVWKAGFRVIYEPRAVIRHYESASSGGNEAAKPAMAANQQKFTIKWKQQLLQHLPNSAANIVSARLSSHSDGLKILYIDDRIPHRALGAGFPRSIEIIKSLVKQGHHVTCSTFTFPLLDNEYTDIPRDVELIDGVAQRDRLFREYLPSSDIIWISRPHNMKAFRQELDARSCNKKLRLIYDAESVFAEREWLQGIALGRRLPEAARETLLREEAALADIADAVAAVSKRDCDTFMRSGLKNVQVVGDRLDAKPTPAGFDSRRTFLFVGAMHGNDNPNADSMRHFCEVIWPRIYRATNAELIIAGYGTDKELANLRADGVSVVGPQEDLNTLYNQARVFVVPTRYAAGIPHKALEAVAYGVPLVVSNLIGSQLGWVHGRDVLIGPNDSAFGDECCNLYQNKTLWECVRSNALERIAAELSEEAFDEAIANLIAAAGHKGESV